MSEPVRDEERQALVRVPEKAFKSDCTAKKTCCLLTALGTVAFFSIMVPISISINLDHLSPIDPNERAAAIMGIFIWTISGLIACSCACACFSQSFK